MAVGLGEFTYNIWHLSQERENLLWAVEMIQSGKHMPHKCEELYLIPRLMLKNQEVIVSVMRRQSQDDPWSSLATSLAYLVNKRPYLRNEIDDHSGKTPEIVLGPPHT